MKPLSPVLTSSLNHRACLACLVAVIAACSSQSPSPRAATTPETLVSKVENEIAGTLVTDTLRKLAGTNPELATRLGLPGAHNRWNSPTAPEARARTLVAASDLMDRSINRSELNLDNWLRVTALMTAARFHPPTSTDLNPVSGPQSRMGAFLINVHPTRSLPEFESWVDRVAGIAPAIEALIETPTDELTLDANGAAAVVQQCAALTTGAPFEGRGLSPLLDEFMTRLSLSALAPVDQRALIQKLNVALLPTRRACAALTAFLSGLADLQGTSMSALPGGNARYISQLAWYTSSTLGPMALHRRAIATLAGMPAEPIVSHPPLATSVDAIQALLSRAGEYVMTADAASADLTSVTPAGDLEIRALEPFRAPLGMMAGYVPAGPDTPAVTYLNPQRVTQARIRQLVHRYSVPGSHLVPPPVLPGLVSLDAIYEGWGLYSFSLVAPNDAALEIRLAAAYAAIDTGIHSGHWSRDDAFTFLAEETGVDQQTANAMISDVFARPGRMSAAFAGLDTISGLRSQSQARLGKDFDARQFHDVLLRSGALPLPVVAELVSRWPGETKLMAQ